MPALESIFAIWKPLSDLAHDLDLPYDRIAKWKQRGRIPSDAWAAVIEAARARGKKITFQQLAAINPPRQNSAA